METFGNDQWWVSICITYLIPQSWWLLHSWGVENWGWELSAKFPMAMTPEAIHGDGGTQPGKRSQKTMENQHFSRVNNLFLWAMFNSVKLPESTLSTPPHFVVC